MSILRSFMVTQGASEARFTADVVEFLGVTAGPGGAIVLTRCRGTSRPGKPTLIGPNGLALAQREGDDWTIYTLLDGMEPPAGAQYIGGLAGAVGGSPTGIFFFARRTAQGNDA
jgi:hypothetical protein